MVSVALWFLFSVLNFFSFSGFFAQLHTLRSLRRSFLHYHFRFCLLRCVKFYCLLNPGKTGRSCSFSRRKISRKTSGTRVHKNWCSRILFRLSYHWRLGDPIIKLPPWNDAWKIFKNSCYFRCRKRYLTAGSKFYLSRYCFFSRCKKEVDHLLWVPWLASDSCFLFSCVP